MSFINTKAGEIGVKIVYFGPALAGKSTNIRLIHRKTRPELRGRLDQIAGGVEPMLAFDFAPDTLPRIDNRFRVRLHLVTVPGPALSPMTRKLVLNGVDAIVFVADTQEDGGELTRFDENVETMELMMAQLEDLNVDTAVMPLVIQYNKRDLTEPGPALSDSLPPHCRPVLFSPLDALNEAINPNDVPTVEAIANQGHGVMDTLRTLVKQLLEPLRAEYEASGSEWPRASNSGRWPRF
jgi:signal recognition particle receptor subunit beta